MIRRWNEVVFAVGVASLATIGAVASVSAQETTGAGQPAASGAMSVAEIRECLCAKIDLDARRVGIDEEREDLEAREAELLALDDQINAFRTAMNPSDIVAQEILKGMLQQQNSLRVYLQSTLRANLNASVVSLAEGIETYNRQCTNRTQYVADLEAVQRDLQCKAR